MPAFIQPSFAKGLLSPALHGRVDTAAYQVGLATARNCIVHSYGGISNRPGFEYLSPVKDHSYPPRMIKFQFKRQDEYELEFGDMYMRVIRNDAHVTEPAKNITGITSANPVVVTIAAHGYSSGNELFLDGIVGMTRLNGRRFRVGAVTSGNLQLLDQVDGSNIDGTGYGAYISGGTAAKIYEIATPYAIADVYEMGHTQSADVMTLTHRNYSPRELSRTGHSAWALNTITFAPSIAAPSGGTAAVNGTSGSTTINYVVTAVKDETFEESLPTAAITTSAAPSAAANVTISGWSAVTGAVKYAVYRQRNGIYGLIGETEDLSGRTFTDNNIEVDLDTTPPKARNPFSAASSYPGTVSYFEQRRVFGGSINAPDTSNYTQTGRYSNMSISEPLQDDDAITATLPAQQVNEIRHYIPGNDLLALTSASEWRINSGSDSVFSGITIKQKLQSQWGSSYLKPITIGNTSFYVLENGAGIRSLGYSLNIDGYTGGDMTLLVQHLFERYTIRDWSHRRAPDNFVHVVRSDGSAAVMTQQQEQEVLAWTTWDTMGKFEQVSTLTHATGETEDRAYFVIKRRINGRTVRYIEKLHSRQFDDVRDCFFVDCGLSYDSPKDITNVTFNAGADTATVFSTAHGFSNGDEVDLFDIEWYPSYDSLDNEVQPTQLNKLRYTVTAASANSFVVDLTEDGDYTAGDCADYSAYVEGGTARKAVDTVTGLDHLEGATVQILADGDVVTDEVVANGSVSLDRKYSRWHIGLKYVSDIETLNIEAPQGTIQGKYKKVADVVVRFLKSRGLLIGHTSSEMEEMKQREFEAMGEPTALLTGDKKIPMPADWNRNGRVFIRQRDPLPMTILAVIPFMALEDVERE